MSPLLISILLFVAMVGLGTVLGALAFIGVGNLLRSPVESARAHGASFVGSLTATMFYALLLRFLDDPQQPLIGQAFFIASGAGLLVSFVAILKSFDIEMSKVPLMWLPFGAGLAASFFLARSLGEEWRESYGFYRGYESVANLSLLEPPDAMSTPEKAILYYNNQYGRLQKANEDTGIGKIFTTATHWDAKWFNDSYPYIVQHMSKSDRFGLTKIIQDPSQQRMMALGRLARPIYGTVKDVHIEGSEALVLMDSGQLVRLFHAGKNWKVRDWLGMRPIVMREIHELKEQNKALTEEDRRAHEAGFQQYEQVTREMAARAKFPYTPYAAILAQPRPGEKPEGTAAAGGGTTAGQSPTGYRKLDAAPAGALVDLQNEQKEDPNAAPPTTPAGTGASGTPAASDTSSVNFAWAEFFQTLGKADRNDPRAVAEFLNQISTEDRTWFAANAVYLADIVTPGRQYNPQQAQLVALQALARTMPRQVAGTPRSAAKGVQGAAQLVDQAQKNHTTLLALENGKWLLAHPFFARTYYWVPQLAQYKRARNLPLGPDEQAALASGVAPIQQQVQQILAGLGMAQ